jgi:hypothetical protein
MTSSVLHRVLPRVMSQTLLTKYTVGRVIGTSRLRRLLRAKWLKPQTPERNAARGPILFSPRDMHAALRPLERQACPPDRLEVARVRASEARHGHGYVKHPRKPPPGLDELELNLSALDLMAVVQSGPEEDFM